MKTTKAFFLSALLVLAATSAFAQANAGPKPQGAVDVQLPAERADAATNVCHSHSTGATCTLTVGAAGTNTQTAYVTGIDYSVCQDATGATPAATTFITTTGFNGNPQYQAGSGNTNAAVLGTCTMTTGIAFSAPLKSNTPGTSPTFVLPTFATHQTISLNVYYKLGY